MHEVYCKKLSSYNYDTLKPEIYNLIESVGPVNIQKGSIVLIKPNFLMPASEESAVLTNPNILRAVTEYVLDKGAVPRIGDSPATGNLNKIMKEGGFEKALRGLNAEIFEFKRSRLVDIGKPYGQIEISEDVIEADAVINLPRLKTHAMMKLTMGAKNLFGCIVGFRKPQWHLRAGFDRDAFAELIVQIGKVVNPSITILDGITSLEGEGPGKGGTPVNTGVIFAGENPFAVDYCACEFLGINPSNHPTTKQALDKNFISQPVTAHNKVEPFSGFRFPVDTSPMFGPKPFQKFSRKHLVQRPVVNKTACILCKKCSDFCPAEAITISNQVFSIDYDKCIRCYCCVEICPEGALKSVDTILGKGLKKIAGLKKQAR